MPESGACRKLAAESYRMPTLASLFSRSHPTPACRHRRHCTPHEHVTPAIGLTLVDLGCRLGKRGEPETQNPSQQTSGAPARNKAALWLLSDHRRRRVKSNLGLASGSSPSLTDQNFEPSSIPEVCSTKSTSRSWAGQPPTASDASAVPPFVRPGDPSFEDP